MGDSGRGSVEDVGAAFCSIAHRVPATKLAERQRAILTAISIAVPGGSDDPGDVLMDVFIKPNIGGDETWKT